MDSFKASRSKARSIPDVQLSGPIESLYSHAELARACVASAVHLREFQSLGCIHTVLELSI